MSFVVGVLLFLAGMAYSTYGRSLKDLTMLKTAVKNQRRFHWRKAVPKLLFFGLLAIFTMFIAVRVSLGVGEN